MSAGTLAKLWEEADQETEAGNYFIANYPPFSFWHEGQSNRVQALLLTDAPGDKDLGLYFHVPFCRKRCHFCYFRVYTDKNASQIQNYLDACMKELESYVESSYIAGRKPSFIYFGGGTPSYLSVRQLDQLTRRMKELMPWDNVEEVAFEAEPGTLTPSKLEAIRSMGVTRLSLGIENFDDHVLETNGRAHRSREVERAYYHARELGFPQINIDLIAGMLNETEENWHRNVEKALELEPDCLTIYQMEVPYNTGIYKKMKEEGTLKAPVADWGTKRRWVNEAFHKFEQAGYEVTSTCTVVKNSHNTRFLYRDSLWSGADLLGLGVASFSHLGGIHYQNIAHLEPYLEVVDGGKKPIGRALETTSEERMIREFILQMKLGRVSESYFKNKFKTNIAQKFKEEFLFLSDNSLLTKQDDWWVLSKEALLRVDRLLQAFFLPQHQNARYT
ncbi:MAG: coproporphyrinogen-III oxidase family protein [Verrucomicrobiota bacterium]